MSERPGNSNFQHFLVTRFGYRRAGGTRTPGFFHGTDPLDPARIEHRLDLLKDAVLPAVLAQTERDFSWVFLIDRDLSPKYRRRLEQVASALPSTALVEYTDDETIHGLEWLSPFVRKGVTHVITTNVDDDDLPCDSYVESCRRLLGQLHAEDRLPSAFAIGTTDYRQWDLVWGRRAPLGYVKPWHRSPWPTNARLTLCSRYPQQDVSVLAIEHTVLPDLVQSCLSTRDREKLIRGAELLAEDWEAWTGGSNFHDLARSGSGPHVLVGNHFFNDQLTRVFERRDTREPFNPALMPGFTFDRDQMKPFLEKYGKTTSSVLRRHLRSACVAEIRRAREARGVKRVTAPLMVPMRITRASSKLVREFAVELRFGRLS